MNLCYKLLRPPKRLNMIPYIKLNSFRKYEGGIHMKKNIAVVAALAAVIGFSGAVSAADDTSFKSKAGITPDNVILYPFDKAIEKIQLKFASDPVKQAELLANFAEERLGESEEMAAKGKEKYEEDVLNDYKDKISQAADKIKAEAQDSEDKDEAFQKKLAAIDQRMKDLDTKSNEILDKLGANASDNAKATLQAVLEMQKSKLTAMKEVFEAKQALVPLKTTLQQAREALASAKAGTDEAAIKEAQTALDKAMAEYNTGKEAVKNAKSEVKSVGEIKKEAVTDKKEKTDENTDKVNKGKGAENSNKAGAQQHKGQKDKTGTEDQEQ